MSLSTYYHTIKHLTIEQLWFQVYYKLRTKIHHLFGWKVEYTFYKEGNRIPFLSFPPKVISYEGDKTFCFLNQTHRFNGIWDDRTLGDLWRYNLNYMDFILQPSLDVTEGVAWIEHFINSVDTNKIATDPYPISLRGINWIKFISLHWDKLSDAERRKIDTSLYSQYRALYGHTERHLMANHYLENGFSLLFAAVYFRDKFFWRKAKKILEQQLKEQILHDGAHYELSPMYHCIILERVLDCYNLLDSIATSLFDDWDALRKLLNRKACQMLEWLDAIVIANDQIPLLNDSAYGIALLPKTLRNYAKSLGMKWGSGALGISGYRRIVRPHYKAVLDMAPLGVSYNLGHSHADTGTFLLWVNGRELVVDTGTSTYSVGKQRDYERSTRAHNTVEVNHENSSKVWGAFRCAQRAQVMIEADGPDIFTLTHDGYHDKGIICRRSFVCKDESLEIIDTIQNSASYDAVAYFHLSPTVQILKVDNFSVTTNAAIFTFEGCDSLQLVKESVAEEYNLLQPSLCLHVKFSGMLHTIIHGFE